MSFFKKINSKTLVLSSIICAVAAVNLLTLVFTIAKGEFSTLSGLEVFSANGFTFAFGEPPTFVDKNALWMKFFSLIQFFASLIIIGLILCFVFIKRKFDLTKLSILIFCVSFVTGLFYLINGIITYGAAAEIKGDNYSSMTAVFVPMIFLAVLIGFYYIIKTQMPDNYSFKPEKKNKRS